ncbi:hypothetical protein FB446DRAFT_800637 [Lentinula raphanica]|nr:hypothetical protein FB446DRAFT_800637 [Lentinula raphanica]
MTHCLAQYVYVQGLSQEEIGEADRNLEKVVHCCLCRLWGKVQTAGLATVMKIPYELDDNVFNERLQATTRFISMAQPPAHAEPEERIDINNVRGGFGDDFSETDGQSVCDTRLRDKGVRSLEALTQWWLEPGGFGRRGTCIVIAKWDTIVVWMSSAVYTDKAKDDLNDLKGLEELAGFRITNDWLLIGHSSIIKYSRSIVLNLFHYPRVNL